MTRLVVTIAVLGILWILLTTVEVNRLTKRVDALEDHCVQIP